MTHEFIEIVQNFKTAKQNNVRSVLATVVDLDGSSYRKPGVRMLIHENGEMTGAVSGGCVEKEILKQSHSVFQSGIAKIMIYDGRYRLGCEGVLYILIEVFDPMEEMIFSMEECIKKREPFEIASFFEKEGAANSNFGSVILIGGKQYLFNRSKLPFKGNNSELKVFRQKLDPLLRLIIIGEEHDAVLLSSQAYSLGWEVIIISSPLCSQDIDNFPGAKEILHISSNSLDLSLLDSNTAIVLMTHNYAKDLQFLTSIKNTMPIYLGLLGATDRRERLLNELIERDPEIKDSFLDIIHGPTGLNIGAITPQEIALSICAEILSVIRKEKPKPLKNFAKYSHSTIVSKK